MPQGCGRDDSTPAASGMLSLWHCSSLPVATNHSCTKLRAKAGRTEDLKDLASAPGCCVAADMDVDQSIGKFRQDRGSQGARGAAAAHGQRPGRSARAARQPPRASAGVTAAVAAGVLRVRTLRLCMGIAAGQWKHSKASEEQQGQHCGNHGTEACAVQTTGTCVPAGGFTGKRSTGLQWYCGTLVSGVCSVGITLVLRPR